MKACITNDDDDDDDDRDGDAVDGTNTTKQLHFRMLN
jgi:hypothetical protein